MALPSSFTPTGFPFGISAPGQGLMAVTNPLALPQTSTKTIFTITGGPVYVQRIFGVITTVIGAVANATKLTATPTIGGAATDICATVDINAAAAGDIYVPITSFATAASLSTAAVIIALPGAAGSPLSFMMTPGTILVNCAGSDGGTGRIQWFMHYVPLQVGLALAGMVNVSMPLS